MRIPNSTSRDNAILQYNQFSDSPASSERIKAPIVRPVGDENAETYKMPEVRITPRPAVIKPREKEPEFDPKIHTTIDGDLIDLDFARIKRFVDRFGWDKIPPDNLRGIEHYREKTVTIYNQDGDRLDINYRAAVGQNASIFGDRALAGADSLKPTTGCSTCESRRYVDQSDDSSVSYQTPTQLNPQTAAVAIASHEREHVSNEQGRAQRENREIVNQTVSIQYAVCSECNTMYPSGGTTRTTSVSRNEEEQGNEQMLINPNASEE